MIDGKKLYQPFEEFDNKKLSYFELFNHDFSEEKPRKFGIKYKNLIMTRLYPLSGSDGDSCLLIQIFGQNELMLKGYNLDRLATLFLNDNLKVAYSFNPNTHYLLGDIEEEIVIKKIEE